MNILITLTGNVILAGIVSENNFMHEASIEERNMTIHMMRVSVMMVQPWI